VQRRDATRCIVWTRFAYTKNCRCICRFDCFAKGNLTKNRIVKIDCSVDFYQNSFPRTPVARRKTSFVAGISGQRAPLWRARLFSDAPTRWCTRTLTCEGWQARFRCLGVVHVDSSVCLSCDLSGGMMVCYSVSSVCQYSCVPTITGENTMYRWIVYAWDDGAWSYVTELWAIEGGQFRAYADKCKCKRTLGIHLPVVEYQIVLARQF
jgi:hypothetical protein